MAIFKVQRGKAQTYINKSYSSCTLYAIWCLMFVWSFMKVSWKVFNFWKRHSFAQGTAIYNVQRSIIQEKYKQELLFLCSARRFMVLYLYEVSWKYLQLFWSLVDTILSQKLLFYKVQMHQRGRTKKIYINKSYESCALHVVLWGLLLEWSFIKTSLIVLKL